MASTDSSKPSTEAPQSASSSDKNVPNAGPKTKQVPTSQRLKQRVLWGLKKLLVFLLSNVGMTFLVALYAVAGGFIFQYLERDTSDLNLMSGHADEAYCNTSGNHSLDQNFVESLQAVRHETVEKLWETTEKYNVLQSQAWRNEVYHELEAYGQTINRLWRRRKSILGNCSGFDPEDSNSENKIGWTYPRALLFAISVITTIGYGDTTPQTDASKIACMVYALFGIPLTLICLTNLGSLLASSYRFTWKNVSHMFLVIVRSPKRNDPMTETSKIKVPVSVSLATMTVYIIGGSILFSQWESWGFLDGCYFCFVTLTTIGFGDYVPGQNKDMHGSNVKRVVCALYLLFGLALLSMTFQLIQDSVTLIAQHYASLLGLSKAKIDDDVKDHQENLTEIQVTNKNPHSENSL